MVTVGDRCLGHVEGTANKDGRLSDSAAIITGLGEDAGTGVTATECGLGSGHLSLSAYSRKVPVKVSVALSSTKTRQKSPWPLRVV